ncbi:hypothetical protein [Streptomyces sp. NPDC047014]|uniref:hypothetical protein n=1 Tax=Streptomyces sp. NPDC047014 TaxID=3155736 RepID=UPI0033FC3C98
MANSLQEFSSGLAPRLSSGWTPSVQITPHWWSRAYHRLWEHEGSVLWRALHEDHLDSGHRYARAFLTHDHGLQLHVVQRPYRTHQFLIGALLPAGIVEYDTTPRPSAIAVPADPARAAAAVRRRFLPYYRVAASATSRSTRFQQAQKVVIGRSAEGLPLADVLSPRAVRALLREDGRWRLDPATGLCTAIASPQAPEDLVQDAAERLRGLSFEVLVSDQHPLDPFFRTPPRAAPGPVVAPPPRASGPHR